MTEQEKLAYWRKYARQTARYERNGVIQFRRAIREMYQPVILHAQKYGVQSALDNIDNLVRRAIMENAYLTFYLYVGTTHKKWSDNDLFGRLPKKKERGSPPIPPSMVGVESADAGFGMGFYNPKWLQKLKRLVYGLKAAQRITSVTNTIKKKLRAVLGRAVKEEVRPSRIAARIQSEMGDKFNEARARLIARTESTYIANVAARESALEAIEAGIALDKYWIHTHDDLVRDTHFEVDQLIDFYEKFQIGDSLMDHPGDPEGGAEEVCNCRCCVAYVPKVDKPLNEFIQNRK